MVKENVQHLVCMKSEWRWKYGVVIFTRSYESLWEKIFWFLPSLFTIIDIVCFSDVIEAIIKYEKTLLLKEGATKKIQNEIQLVLEGSYKKSFFYGGGCLKKGEMIDGRMESLISTNKCLKMKMITATFCLKHVLSFKRFNFLCHCLLDQGFF